MQQPKLIWALDLATKTGFVQGRIGETPRISSVQFAKDGDEHEDAFRRALTWFADQIRIAGEKPDYLYIEAPINPAMLRGSWDEQKQDVVLKTNPDTTIRLIGFWAVISAAAGVKNIAVRNAHVSSVRKAFLGAGNLKGDVAKKRARALCDILGWAVKNNDESDAAAVWFYGCQKVAPQQVQFITPMQQGKAAEIADGGRSATELFGGRTARVMA